MTFDEAVDILEACEREECRDHAFGDRELYWMLYEDEVAVGYFGGGQHSVSVRELDGEEWTHFKDFDAVRLSKMGTLKGVSRNDETGPAIYRGA